MAPQKYTMQQRMPRKGGRRPKEEEQYEVLSYEEEERRRKRRERNREAAARCRFRKSQRIEELEMEKKQLQERIQALEATVRQLWAGKKELEYIVETHVTTCNLSMNISQLRRTTSGDRFQGPNTGMMNVNGFDQCEIGNQSFGATPYTQRPSSLDFCMNDVGMSANELGFMDPMQIHSGLTPACLNGMTPMFASTDGLVDLGGDNSHTLLSMQSANHY